MPSYSSSFKKDIVAQLMSGEKTLEQLQQEHHISRTTLFRWQAQYRSLLKAAPMSDLNDQEIKHHGLISSQVEHNHELFKIWSPADHYEHKLCYHHGAPSEATLPKDKIDPSTDDNVELASTHNEPSDHETTTHSGEGYYKEYKLLELLQAAFKAQMSLWHGPKCQDLERYFGFDISTLREFYEQICQEGLVCGSRYSQLAHQLVAAQEQLKAQEQKIALLETKEQIYRFYLENFRRQSALYKLDFNSLNEGLKQDFLSLITKLNNSGMTIQEATDMMGINMRTYYRWVKQTSHHEKPEHELLSDEPTKYNHPNELSALCDDQHLKDINPNVLQDCATKNEYKFISSDELELIKEILQLDEYSSLKVRDCYNKLKDEQLLTMSLSTFYRTVNKIKSQHDPSKS